MSSPSVQRYLSSQQSNSSGEVSEIWHDLQRLYENKLWHQLTLKLQDFIKHPSLNQSNHLVELYENFITDFEHRINPLSLMEMMLYVIKQISDADALVLLDKLKDNIKVSDEAMVLCLTTIGRIKLKQVQLDETMQLMKQIEQLLDNLDEVTSVHGHFYDLCSKYYKVTGNHAEYYRNALRYLGCVNLDDIPGQEQLEQAFNLCLAAILGKNVYNFGELLQHPILNVLKSTEQQWLVNLLLAFNSGNISQFEKLKSQWEKQADLAAQETEMREKITLLCLMEMVFKRPANSRQLSFQEISNETRLPVDMVEVVVMRALSLGLVKGSIDEVQQKVHMTWVQPRVLEKEQIMMLKNKMESWYQDVLEMEKFVEDKAHDILT